uniref:Uncharacterized protein n=1 Tax=Ammonifex degensii TaxID=42838 RepID=A0A7C2E9V8_9THEO
MDEKLSRKSLARLKEEEGEENRLFQEIRRQEFARELPLIWLTLLKLGRGEIRMKDFLGGTPPPAVDISGEVDRLLGRFQAK